MEEMWFSEMHRCLPVPVFRIVPDILTNAFIGLGIADDVFVVVGLPNITDFGMLSEPFGKTHFKTAND